METDLIYHPRAAVDVREIAEKYARISDALVNRFWGEFDGGIAAIRCNPGGHHFDASGLRRCNLNRFPYHILFEERLECVRVIVVRHHHRNPSYGVKRARVDMGAASTTEASLRVTGEALVPDEISKLLGCSPTSAQKKGELVEMKKGATRVAGFGRWRLDASTAEPGDLEGQIFEILDQLTDDLGVWTNLQERFEVDLFCGVFMRYLNEEFSFSPAVLHALAIRRIPIEFDLYGGGSD